MFMTKSTAAHTVLTASAPMANSAPLYLSRLPTARMARKARNGVMSMIQAVSAQNPPVTAAEGASAAASTTDPITAAPGLPTSDFRLPPRPSPSHQVEFVDVGGLAVAEDHDDDRQADTHLGGGHRDHEDREQLTDGFGRPPHRLERDEVDVDG